MMRMRLATLLILGAWRAECMKCGEPGVNEVTCQPSEQCTGTTDEHGLPSPLCRPYCDSGADCNGRAVKTEYFPDGMCNAPRYYFSDNCPGTSPTCKCTCDTKYEGVKCENCSPSHKAESGDCVPRCTVAASCNGRGTDVVWVVADTCSCTCKNQWKGAACETCSKPHDGADCNTCLAGYVKYPGCTQCTSEVHCSGHADSVTDDGSRATCVCSCTAPWEGGTCSTCPANFKGSKCDSCASGYITHPECKQCTVTADCNNNAKSVTDDGTNTKCACTCKDGFEGNACDKCAAGYVGYPNCRQCTSAADCSGHASLVTSDAAKALCVCTKCSDQWSGSKCETCVSKYDSTSCNACAVGHVGYPTCTECTVVAHCTNHALSVTDDGSRGLCKCACRDHWTGEHCETCPKEYDATKDCAKCATGRISYPTCTLCTSKTHCNGHAKTATSDAPKMACVCDCSAEYTGAKCDMCAAGRIDYPTCTECTVADSCSGHAKSVAPDTLQKACVCVCDNQWSGTKCDTCEAKYDATACATCAQGYIGYPGCTQCTSNGDCNGHATRVTDDGARKSCVCTCAAGYEGATCDKCKLGYVGYPNCRLCTSAADCTGHASAVTSDATRQTCMCTCKGKWADSKCSTCPAEFGGTGCDTCAAGRVGYPECRLCDVSGDCSSHASTVTDDGTRASCVCKCSNQWKGLQCQTCPSTYGGANCDKCATGRITYPGCAECKSSTHCSNHAESVTSDTAMAACVCTCRNQWKGPICDQCDAKFENDCGECAAGYIKPYPGCTQCTVDTHCSSHAKSVSDDGKRDACSCVCRNQWTGLKCETCPANFGGADCNECAVGQVNYPMCGACTVQGSCSNHATAPVGTNADKTACDCKCTDQWTGTKCETCPTKFGTGSECNMCASGYITYPECKQCTVTADCNNNAKSVTDDGTNTKCACTCNDGFEGNACDKCAAGYVGYPNCRQCTSAADCSGHADSVTDDGTRATCMCTCSKQFTGLKCADCPAIFEGSACDRCKVGHVEYPKCRECTSTADCTGHAASVVDVQRKTCKCNCADQWSGTKCQTCPAEYTGAKCDVCAAGRIDYPTCTECTVADSCSGHAKSVAPDTLQKACVCVCDNQWSGTKCDTCEAKYDATACATCAQGYIGYPGCTQCTSNGDCNGHATRVTDDGARKSCVCTCAAGYEGATCDKCKLGYVGYPNCRLCTSAADCTGHASAVTSDATRQTCMCTCKGKWADSKCSTCPSLYDAALLCNNCAEGHINFETCTKCTSKDHCLDRATSVTDDGTRTTCACTCGNQWKGLQCQTCPSKYGGANCDKCATGRITYPGCAECKSSTHCSNHAESVTSDTAMAACVCTCRNQWKGPICDQCDAKFENDCGECAAGYIKPYPGCTQCTVDTHCSSHAKSVSDDGKRDACSCVCRNQWTGLKCETCPAKYGGADCDKCASTRIKYPACDECTIASSCSNHASAVSTNTDNTACKCTCSHQWTGLNCETCASKYTVTNCDSCASGYITYPECKQCTVTADCNNNAKSVTDDGTNTKCACTCEDGFEGNACDKCAAGYVGYPNCRQCMSAADCSGHADSVTDDGTRATCMCTCSNHFTGPKCADCPLPYGGSTCKHCAPAFDGDEGKCDRCNVGYIKYPTCTPCLSSKHCNGHASAMIDDGMRSECVCTCEARYSGPTCDVCAAGHVNYPTCTQCTSAAHCTSHAENVTDDGSRTTCVCSCQHPWQGAKCDKCPAAFDPTTCNKCAKNHIGYPTCRPCDLAADCKNALSVADDGTRETCVCECRNQWTGKKCDTCPPLYGGADCDECASGIGYPLCGDCTNATSCNGHASAVQRNALQTACDCTCLFPWEGPKCATCPPQFAGAMCDACAVGMIGFPTCTLCTSQAHCNNHAASATDDGTRTACACKCQAMYEGDTCDACVAGSVEYPTCRPCDRDTDCSGHAFDVTDEQRATCKCTCRNQWDGKKCEICPAKYGGSDCNSCAVGHIKYPKCDQCTLQAHCSGHADNVTAENNVCKCKCSNQWTDEQCQTCPSKYGGANCDKCATGRITYPGCAECKSSTHCSNHAESVTSDTAMAACVCTCRNQWKGPICDQCDAKFENDCGECAAGYIKPYPGCTQCTVDTHCSSHAKSVSDDGKRDACSCVCRNQWTGLKCETCPAKYGGADCDKCASQGVQYPSCGVCTEKDSCSDHAVSVTTNSQQTQCVCACRNQWSGVACDTCEKQFSGSDCNECAIGYIGYSQCTECTVATHCTGHASAVTDDGERRSCVCTCNDQWTGKDCSTCPAKYGGGKCDQCAAKRTTYPLCIECTTSSNCSDHAVSVDDDGTRARCVCDCRNQWGGLACETCLSPHDGVDCDTCLPGYITYPMCAQCTTDTHCNGHAVSVTDDGTRATCSCTCRNQWTGNACQTCGTLHEGPDCDKCATGHIVYPTCDECSIAKHCNGRATYVTDDGTRTACVCTCMNAWRGEKCETCPVEFGGANCDECAAGYIGTLATGCTQCSDQVHCSGHAAPMKNDDSLRPNVTDDGTRSQCVCGCRNQWTGGRCQTCPLEYLQGGDCDTCAALRVGYPACTLCDNKVHCSGHAKSVAVDPLTDTCACTCSDQWNGKICDQCDAKYVQDTCDKCATGYVNYPSCEPCTLDKHCSGHAVNVTSNAAGELCVCECRNQWSGLQCDVCDSAHYTGNDCDRCSTGFINYPFCGDACLVKMNCSGNANTVKYVASSDSCLCDCKDKWGGLACNECDAKYSQLHCDFCAPNHVQYPVCDECTNATSCSGHAVSVRADGKQLQCLCECMNFWTDANCATCPPGLDAECKACKAGWKGIAPQCVECNNAAHCSGHAASIEGTSDACVCTCRNKWQGTSCSVCPSPYSGADCDTCAAGLMNFPTCEPACVLDRNCSNALKVAWQPPNTCHCDCKDQWTGSRCDACPSIYNATTCDACAAGHTHYPDCTQCTVQNNCNGHATSVTDDGTRSTCTCTCANHWTGPNCAACPALYGGANCDICGDSRIKYPQCDKCSVDLDCSGHATAVTADVTQTMCVCSCRNQWTGPKCDTCPGLYSGSDCDRCAANRADYPTCGEPCTVAANCSGNAESVQLFGGKCVCNGCRNGWRGLSCELCVSPFTGPNCNLCEAGSIASLVGANVGCTACSTSICTIANALGVTDDGNRKSCVCSCKGMWTGTGCGECPLKFAGLDCSVCATGLANFPDCTPCDLDRDCSLRGVAVSAVSGVCKCTCQGKWTGDSCDVCPPEFDGDNGCSSCSKRAVGTFPNCVLIGGGRSVTETLTLTLSPTLTNTSTLPLNSSPGEGGNGTHLGGTSVTPTLTLTPTLFDKLLAISEDDGRSDCWEPFVGWCWWLLVLLFTTLCSCGAAVAFLYYRSRKAGEFEELEKEAVGEETFDHFAKLAEENSELVLAEPPQEMGDMAAQPSFRDMAGGVQSPAPSSLEDPLLQTADRSEPGV